MNGKKNYSKQLRIFLILVFFSLITFAGEDEKPIKVKKVLTKPVISSVDETNDSDTNYIYQGIWSDSLNSYTIKPLRLSGFDMECVVTYSSSQLEVIQFVCDSWQTFAHIPYSVSYYYYYDHYSWTTGDLDNDGSDDIITCQDSLVIKYKWNGKKFQAQTMVLPFIIEQVRIGDINNNGDNEMVFFYGESLPNERINFRHHLGIAKWDSTDLHLLWDDSAKLGYGVGYTPDYLLFIADVTNKGYNQLIVSRAQTDVSPTQYDLLLWNDKKGSLEFNRSFQLTNQVVPGDSLIDSLPFISGRLTCFNKNDTTYVSGSLFTAGKEHSEIYYNILKIEGDSLIQARSIFNGLTSGTCFIDIDGNGIGLLVIWREPPSTTNMFRFYRL